MASIIGSGFLVLAPLLASTVAEWAPVAPEPFRPITDLERVSRVALGFAYPISVAFYLPRSSLRSEYWAWFAVRTASRFGYYFSRDLRVRTMRSAQLIGDTIYVAFGVVVVPFFEHLGSGRRETAIADAARIVSPVLVTVASTALAAARNASSSPSLGSKATNPPYTSCGTSTTGRPARFTSLCAVPPMTCA